MSQKRIISYVISLVIILAVSAIYGLTTNQTNITNAPAAGYYAITSFTDGDTITVNMNGNEEKIRLIGVDTPETKKPNSPVQCFGPEASDFTKKLIGNQNVRLEADPRGDNRDRYDRLLRYVYLPDGTLVNQKIISEGFGFAYLSFDFSKSNDFAMSQSEAQSAKRGLWSTCKAIKESSGRWQTEGL